MCGPVVGVSLGGGRTLSFVTRIVGRQIKNKYGGLQKPGGKFYDIGSGTGKPVRVCAARRWQSALESTRRRCLILTRCFCALAQTFAAALLHDWTSCVGIEVRRGCPVDPRYQCVTYVCLCVATDSGGPVQRVVGAA